MPIDLTILYFFCGIFNLLLGLVVISKDIKKKSGIAFFLFTLSVFVWVLSLYYGFGLAYEGMKEYSFAAIRLAYASSLFVGYFIAVFFYFFPKETFSIPKPVQYLSLVVVGILSAVAGGTDLVHVTQIYDETGTYIADDLGPLYLIYLWFFLISLFVACVFAFNKILSSYGIDRKKIWISAVGSTVYILLASMTNVILPQFGIYVWQEQSVAFTLFFTVPTFYAIQKYRFFDLSYISLNLFRYIVLLSIFITTVYIGELAVSSAFPSIDLIAHLSLVAFVALIIINWFREKFPIVVNGGFLKFQNSVKKVISQTYYIDKYESLHKVLEAEFVVSSLISSVKVLIIRNEKNKSGMPIYVNDEFTDFLDKSHWQIIVEDEIDYLKSPGIAKELIREKMKELEAKVLIPLYSEKKLIGLFILGEKSGATTYTKNEIEELLNMKNNLQITVMNILLKSNMQEENNLMKEIIREKTKELNDQVLEIKRLASLQSDFLAVTAHEFRTPLSIAMFQLEDTLDAKKLPDDVANEMKVLESSLSSLKQLTQQLFDVQQFDLEKVNVNMKKIDFVRLIKEIYQEFIPIMREVSLGYRFVDNTKTENEINIDKVLFKQVVHNILTNAKKFVKKDDGAVSVIVEDDPSYVFLKISDNGGGINDDNKKRIFEKFQSQDATKSMGIGLGLYLCKKIIKLHNGKIWVEDSVGGGATFIIQLPKN